MTDAFCDADFCTDIALGTSCTCADAGSDRIVDASDCRSMARMEFAVPRSLNFDLLLSKPARGYAELVLSNSGGAELSWALGSAEMSDRHAFMWSSVGALYDSARPLRRIPDRGNAASLAPLLPPDHRASSRQYASIMRLLSTV